MTSTLLTISFSQDPYLSLLSLPLLLLPTISAYFNVLIHPRDANIARAIIREVEELNKGKEEDGTVDVMCVVGGNHVDGIREELEKYNNEHDRRVLAD
ncbi:hypothetical protein TrRE_jg1610 [Triparma retinervis]|uniref:Uncharacterized protein n=1 Tax=Triparma retinervis TaxID=2557542 RepID=A0A9W7CHB6_9STRA|nr:hypothetical protein TrRE_jg1610 [Triparma retinervis]